MDISKIQSKNDLPKEMTELQHFTWMLLLQHQKLRERYALLSKRQFGQSSEKTEDLEAVQQEMDELLAEIEEAMDTRSDEESFDTIPIKPHTRRRRHPGRNVIPDSVETEEIVHDIPDEEKHCDCCGDEKSVIGKKEHVVVTRIPARYKKIVHVRPVYACSKCKCGISVAEP
ncbi:MAG: hypothetical protein GF401_20945 [Chitinivibrionales bacterium]|nr:hypothetical protein [Chitinivibrionales bacterium]